MNLREYQLETHRTASGAADMYSAMTKEELERKLRMAVAALGLIGEAWEMYKALMIDNDLEHAQEEAGDAAWYCMENCSSFDVAVPAGLDLDVGEVGCHDVMNLAESFVSEVKKHVGQGHAEPTNVLSKMHRIMVTSAVFTEQRVGDMIDGNVRKLRKRFKHGFKASDSINREE